MVATYRWDHLKLNRKSRQSSTKERIKNTKQAQKTADDLASGEFDKRVALAISTSVKLKKIMGKRLITSCRCACPVEGCKGTIHARLAGRKNHIHMQCDACALILME